MIRTLSPRFLDAYPDLTVPALILRPALVAAAAPAWRASCIDPGRRVPTGVLTATAADVTA